jgi:1,4-dihydroxy-2-naphthoate octaprenyltransferase
MSNLGERHPLGIKTMLRVIRAPFFTATVVPVLLGTAIAWQKGVFHLGYFLLTLIGALCIHAGLNMSNDYFDHLSGNDEINRELTPFSGGSRVIQEGILSAREVLRLALTFYFIGITIGLYLAMVRGWPVLALGVVGVFMAFFHNAPPINLYHLGLGELSVGIGFGPLIVLGSFYVQAQSVSYEAFWASIPVGLLIAAVLYINEFPDYAADKAVGKNTLIVVLGRERAVFGYVVLLIAAYVVIIVGVALGIFPYTLLLALLTMPLAYRAIRGAMRFHSDTPRLIPTNVATIQLHLLTGLLLSLSYIIDCGL